MVARMFHEAGLFLGSNLLGQKASNRYGHFEDIEIVRFHDRVLKRHGTSWQFNGDAAALTFDNLESEWLRQCVKERDSHGNWGIKDPRLCLFLNEWTEACGEFYIVAIIRDFISTTRSLLDRHAGDLLGGAAPRIHLRFWQDPDLPYRMWLSYNRCLLDVVRAFPDRSLVVYHSHVLAGLGVPGLLPSSIGLRSIDASTLIDPTITEIGARHLPTIGRELQVSLARMWLDIERTAGPSGIDIECMMQEAFGAEDRCSEPSFEASMLEYDKAHRRYLAALEPYPGFQRRYLRLGDLISADQGGAALSARILSPSLVPASMKLPERSPIDVSWRFGPEETNIRLPEPIVGFNANFPIKTDDQIMPRAGRACYLQDAFLYCDGYRLYAFSETGAPINIGHTLENLPMKWAAAQRLLNDSSRILHFDAPVHVVSSPGPESFYHWMIDICPQLGFSVEMFPEIAVETVYSNGTGLSFQNRTLKLLAPDADLVYIDGPTIVKAPKLVLSLFTNGLGKFVPDWIINFWRKRRLEGARTQRQVATFGEPSRRVFVARKTAGGRALLPADTIQNLMDQQHYRTVYLEDLSLQEQFDTFAEASIVVSAHGAGLTHVLFMEPNSVVVEIFGDHMSPCYRYLAGRGGVGYIPVSMRSQFDNLESRSAQQRNNARFSDITVDIEKLQRALVEAESVLAAATQ
jgi:hypothetical protein